ncbi:hypothetical protein [Oerskovia paurometabola]|uniref:Uncharacterized protein n=1 Tax=Oerskovia paurometabola TaxID=162170 RepID=A0ABW1X7E9_9CELL|nr:hypothetical protein [Oerskovia paurometabola]MBM7497922.1 hypothetical protein [Oerskovia paurometabola]
MISEAPTAADQGTSSARRGLVVCAIATVGATLVGAVPALAIGLSVARYRYVENWSGASSGLLDGERERALFVAGTGILLALLAAAAVFRFVARSGRTSVPAPRVVAACAVLVAASVLTLVVVVLLGSPLAAGIVDGSVPAAGAEVDPIYSA